MREIMILDVKLQFPDEMSEEEARKEYFEDECKVWTKKGKQLARVEVELDGDNVIVKGFEMSPIRRVRRITGYLSEIHNFNDAKEAELYAREVSDLRVVKG